MLSSSESFFSQHSLVSRSNGVQDVGEIDTGEESGRETRRSPGETQRLSNDVLFFSSISGADESVQDDNRSAVLSQSEVCTDVTGIVTVSN